MGEGINAIMLKEDISYCRHLVGDALDLLRVQITEEGEEDRKIHNSVVDMLGAVETRLKNMEKDYTVEV
jgi:hypothetical protein